MAQFPNPGEYGSYGGMAPVPMVQPHRGVLVLVLGIVSLTVCFLTGIFAWVYANTDLAEMDAGRMDPSGKSLTSAGKICGMIGTFLGVVSIIVTVAMMAASIVSHAH